MKDFDTFSEIWVADFEFTVTLGNNPTPVCLTALEIKSGRWELLWLDGQANPPPPYPTGKDSLFVCYFASAEISCHLALNWPVPENVLDLYTEFRNLTNGLPLVAGNGLIGALAHFGLDTMGAAEKTDMRNLIMRGGPWNEDERSAILQYCKSDVEALYRLLTHMETLIDLPRALLRGRYMKAVAAIERNGVPIDVKSLNSITSNLPELKERLISEVDASYGVFQGSTVFRAENWMRLLAINDIPWPHLPSGRIDLSDNAFKEMSDIYPDIKPMRELRQLLGKLRLNCLSIGKDGRNRSLLRPFSSRTGRNQPSNSRFIFGPATWLRGLIRPPPGAGLAYLDWSQQEFGIAAALSGDKAMMEAYSSGDPYLAFAKQAGAVPEDATKQTHSAERARFKACVLAVQYGMGPESLAKKIGQTPAHARILLQLHRQTYKRFWQWSDNVLDFAMTRGYLQTVFGWTLRITRGKTNPRTLRNFPMQANGAEMLRLACCFAVERGIKVIAPVHDAILIEYPSKDKDRAIESAFQAMREASEYVLNGFPLRSDVNTVEHPNRFISPEDAGTWYKIMEIVGEIKGGANTRSLGLRG